MICATPLGPLLVELDEGAVTVARFDDDASPEPSDHPVAAAVARYFAGALDALDDVEVAPTGTEFQQRVWRALREIPVGVTWSYARLAERVGSVARAVGAANGQNPVALFVPCHRVVGKDGALTGYAGGLQRKHRLLVHEKAVLV